jgi:hypothetical protein
LDFAAVMAFVGALVLVLTAVLAAFAADLVGAAATCLAVFAGDAAVFVLVVVALVADALAVDFAWALDFAVSEAVRALLDLLAAAARAP